jgi:hypothetical protein
MNRTTTLAGYVLIAVALVLLQCSAVRARRRGRLPRPLTLGELIVALVQWSQVRWPLLVVWLWLGWHLFARVDWR